MGRVFNRVKQLREYAKRRRAMKLRKSKKDAKYDVEETLKFAREHALITPELENAIRERLREKQKPKPVSVKETDPLQDCRIRRTMKRLAKKKLKLALRNSMLVRRQNEKKQVSCHDDILSFDKGRGRSIATIAFICHPEPCSPRNHLPLVCWKGSDSHASITEKGLVELIFPLQVEGYRIYLGGDLAFISTNYGNSCAMRYACIWCKKEFNKKGNKNQIDLTVYPSREDAQTELEITRQRFKASKQTILPIHRKYVVPPILHAKIKIGNGLFDRLLRIVGNEPSFFAVLKRHKLDVDRRSEGVIYHRFHGNDIKNLCRSIEDLAGVCSDDVYQSVIHAFRVFNEWSTMVSSTKIGLTESEMKKICCRQHTEQGCCQTALLGETLSNVGGFGSSILCHVVIMHLGEFLWTHRFIGAAAEEGIEAVHCRLASEMTRHKRQPMERLRNSLKWLAIDCLLCDAGEM